MNYFSSFQQFEPIQGFTGFLAGDGYFRQKIGPALSALRLFNIGADGCPRPNQLFSQCATDTGLFIEKLAQLHNSHSKNKRPLANIVLQFTIPYSKFPIS